jgi:hypothetical protein
MGYRRKQREYQMEFAQGALAGLIITTKVPRLEQIEVITELANTDVFNAPKPTPEMVGRIRKFCEAMAECITEWNLEDEDGTPIPCNRTSLLAQDIEFLLPLSMGWLDAINTGPDDRDLGGQAEVTEPAEDEESLADLPVINDLERARELDAQLKDL